MDLNNPAANLRWRWIVSDEWKLIVPDAKNEPGGQAELYHIVADPFEKQNLAPHETKLVTEFRRQLDAWWDPQTGN